MSKATPQTGGPARRAVPGQSARAPAAGRTIESGTAAGGVTDPARRLTEADRAALKADEINARGDGAAAGGGPGGEKGEALVRQAAQSTALGSARVPEIPDEIPERQKPQRPAHATTPRELEPKGRGETMVRPSVPPVGPAVLVRDLRKTPRLVGEAGKGMKDAPIEARTEDEAIALANAKGRAILTTQGWVCPTIVKERVA